MTEQILYYLKKTDFNQANQLIANMSLDTFQDQATYLLLTGELYYATNCQIEVDIPKLGKLQKQVLTSWEQLPQKRTDETSLVYGGLKLSNMIVKSEEIMKAIIEIRNYIFNNNINAGTLVISNQNREVDATILRACVPNNLFEPEDLIVVAAFNQILNKREFLNDSRQLINVILYCIDKKENYLSKEFISYFEHNYDTSDYGYKLAIIKYSEIFKSKIIHEPSGNNHPYAPQKYERYPKIITQNDQVTIHALASGQDLKLTYETNGEQTTVEMKLIDREINQFEVVIGPFAAMQDVKYWLLSDDEKSDIYQFTVSQKINGLTIEKVENSSIYFSEIPIPLHFFADEKETLNLQFIDSVPSYKSIDQFAIEMVVETNQIKFTKNNNWLYSINIDQIELTILPTNKIIDVVLPIVANDDIHCFGLGERYNAIIQNNTEIDNYVFSQYKDQGLKTYMPISVLFTNKQFGFFINSNHNTKVAISDRNINIKLQQLSDPIVLLFGEHSSQLQTMYCKTGQPQPVANWVFGPWMSSNNWDSQSEVLKQMDLTLEHQIPSTMLVIEQWSDEATFYNFNDSIYKEIAEHGLKYDEYTYPEWGRWPNPKQMVDQLHENGIKCMLWQIPVIKHVANLRNIQKNLDEQYALSKNLVIKNVNGEPYRIAEDWFKDSLVIDFTNKQAHDWWFSKRQYLVEEIGIDGFKTDGGECLFGDDIVLSNCDDSNAVRNAYPVSYISSYYNYLKKFKPDGLTFSRAGYNGAHTFPAHWAGDERSTFDAFKRSIAAGINAGLSGVIFWSWDLAGFNGDIPTADLYIRSTQMATFCPIMQYHAESKGEFNQDRTPWNIAERTNTPEVIAIYKMYANLRMQLIPYLSLQATKAINEYKPLMRALFIEHTEDEQSYICDDQYYLGDNFLVAPIIEENKKNRNVYFPAGQFTNFFTLETINGNSVQNIEMKNEYFPLFLKYNTITVMNIKSELANDMNNFDTEIKDQVTFIINGENCQIDAYEIKVKVENGIVQIENRTNLKVVIIDLLNTVTNLSNAQNFAWFEYNVNRYDI